MGASISTAATVLVAVGADVGLRMALPSWGLPGCGGSPPSRRDYDLCRIWERRGPLPAGTPPSGASLCFRFLNCEMLPTIRPACWED